MRRHFTWFCRGVALVLLAAVLLFAGVAWSIWDYGARRDAAPADAALVLGAAAWGNRPSPVFRERLNHGVELYRSGQVRWLVLSGGTPVAGYPSEAEVGRRYLLRQGIPEQAVLGEESSRDTWRNLDNARRLAEPFGIRRWLLVSDPLHMRRAVLMARDQGLDAYPSPTPSSRIAGWREQADFLLRETWNLTAYLVVRELDWQ